MFDKTVKIKDLQIEIGRLIWQLRKRDKISQQALAEQLDLSRITIQNLESGKNYTIETMLKAFQYFDLLQLLNAQIKDIKKVTENMNDLY
jgi:transcriptional regulator with XRE-family HTH domain